MHQKIENFHKKLFNQPIYLFEIYFTLISLKNRLIEIELENISLQSILFNLFSILSEFSNQPDLDLLMLIVCWMSGITHFMRIKHTIMLK